MQGDCCEWPSGEELRPRRDFQRSLLTHIQFGSPVPLRPGTEWCVLEILSPLWSYVFWQTVKLPNWGISPVSFVLICALGQCRHTCVGAFPFHDVSERWRTVPSPFRPFVGSHVPSGPRAAPDLLCSWWRVPSPSWMLWEWKRPESQPLLKGNVNLKDSVDFQAHPGKPQQISCPLLFIRLHIND